MSIVYSNILTWFAELSFSRKRWTQPTEQAKWKTRVFSASTTNHMQHDVKIKWKVKTQPDSHNAAYNNLNEGAAKCF